MILINKKYKSIYLVDEGLVSISEVTYQLFMTRPYMHALSLFLHKPRGNKILTGGINRGLN